MSCGVGRRRSSSPPLLWLWCWLATTALIRSLAWEPPYAVGVALEKDKKTKKKNELDVFGVCVCVYVWVCVQPCLKSIWKVECFGYGSITGISIHTTNLEEDNSNFLNDFYFFYYSWFTVLCQFLQQSDPVICILSLTIILHHVPSQVTRYISLCYTAGSNCLPTPNTTVWVY